MTRQAAADSSKKAAAGKGRANSIVGKAGGAVSTGDIVNLVSTDLGRLTERVPFLNLTLGSPILVLVCTGFLLSLLGWSGTHALQPHSLTHLPLTCCCMLWGAMHTALAGVGVYFIVFPLNQRIMGGQLAQRKGHLKVMDTRVKVTSEVVQSMKAIKLYGWEASFLRKLDALR